MKEMKGNLLDVKQGIIAHQVNCRGIMGAGVAKQIRDRLLTKEQYAHYQRMCKRLGEYLLGACHIYQIEKELYVANLFGENVPTGKGLDTDYDALRNSLKELKLTAEQHDLPIYVPGYLGCGLAGGDWDFVYKGILSPLFSGSYVDLRIVYLPESIRKLWDEFCDVTKDQETGWLNCNWHGFPVGTQKEEVWEWFEETFDLNVASDLMNEASSRKGGDVA